MRHLRHFYILARQIKWKKERKKKLYFIKFILCCDFVFAAQPPTTKSRSHEHYVRLCNRFKIYHTQTKKCNNKYGDNGDRSREYIVTGCG